MMSALLFSMIAPAEAVVAKGEAIIVGGDVAAARAEAKRQAMRNAIEQAVGVKVSSRTEVQNFMVISDEISMRAEGYGIINRVVSEKISGEILQLELDVSVSSDKIRATVQDLRSKLEANLEDSQIRGRVQVAIVERNVGGVTKYDPEMSDYFIERMKLQGFEARNNDEVVEYMICHANDPDLRIQARRIARGCEAQVKASFEMIGLDSNVVDTVSRYYKAIGKTEHDAIETAKENATCAAMESLALQALETFADDATLSKRLAQIRNPRGRAAVSTSKSRLSSKTSRITKRSTRRFKPDCNRRIATGD